LKPNQKKKQKKTGIDLLHAGRAGGRAMANWEKKKNFKQFRDDRLIRQTGKAPLIPLT